MIPAIPSKHDLMRIDYGKDNLNELIERLRKKLPLYLKIKGVIPEDWTIEKNTPFKCINPEHDDKSPSMSFIPRQDGAVVRCFGCGVGVDIFKAATFLESRPADGPEWIQENVYYLARELGEDYKESQPTELDLRKAKILKMLADAADVFYGVCKKTSMTEGAKYNPFEYTRKRGFKDDFALEWGFGTVDYEDFITNLIKYGPYDRAFCEANGVNSNYFGVEYCTFVLRDHRGVVVGFDRRFISFNKTDEEANRAIGQPYPKKYFLPHNSEVFDKSRFLYGLYKAKREAHRGLDVVEGYFDALAGIQAGFKPIIAASGCNSLQPSCIELLKSLGVSSLNLVMDNDTAGINACKKYLKEYSGDPDLRLGFRFLSFIKEDEIPDKDKDPHTFFTLYCKHGITEYLKMPVQSAFVVNLSIETQNGVKGEQLARIQIPHIASEPDVFNRGRNIRELSEKTGIPEVDIRAAVDDIMSGKARNIVRDLIRDLQTSPCSPGEVNEVISKATTKLGPLFGGSAQVITKEAAKNSFYQACDAFDNNQGAIAGYRTSIPMLDDNMGGIQKGIFMAIAGNPNSGKSAFTYHIIDGLLRNYTENKDLIILAFSFDDTVNWTYAKLIAGICNLPIKWCARPQEYIFNFPERAVHYNQARAFMESMVDNDLIRVFGGDIGMNMGQINKAIRNAQESTGKHCLVVVDSFNKMQGDAGMEGVTKFEKNANDLHQLIHTGSSVITTCEMVKSAQNTKPKMGDMKDTSKVGYNANVVMIVYNPLHELREKSGFFHVVENPDKPGTYRKAAVVQAEIVKNRLTDYKGEEVFQFYDHIGSFRTVNNIREFMNHQHEQWHKYGHDNYISGPKEKTGVFSIGIEQEKAQAYVLDVD